tara:strand:+ start:8077 stop:8607 length:531 start_codon:yes stop_codon:yes gene_type:complete
MLSIREFAKRGLVFVPTHEKVIVGIGIIFRKSSFVINTTLDVGRKAEELIGDFPGANFGRIAVRLFACVKTTHGVVRLQKPEWLERKSVFDEVIERNGSSVKVKPLAYQLSVEPRGFLLEAINVKPKFRVELDSSDWELDATDALIDSREKLERLKGRGLPYSFVSKCFDLTERPT